MDSITGSQDMKWVGSEPLSTKPIMVDEYKAKPSLPDLTAPDVTKAFGKETPKDATDTNAGGKDWSVTVGQSDFATTVRYLDICENLTDDADEAIKVGNEALVALGMSPDDWSWFTITDANGAARAIAEPSIEGRQTWATGTFAVLVNDDGTLCAANGILMRFEKTGKSDKLNAPYEVFEEARHSEGLAMAGKYNKVEQTWTLNTQGILSPLWRFLAPDHGIVAVQLGDGLETTFDTESSLTDAIAKGSEKDKSDSADADK
jgi:hypothetical protein